MDDRIDINFRELNCENQPPNASLSSLFYAVIGDLKIYLHA